MTPGSSLYYSVLALDKPTREIVLRYRAIYDKLRKIKPVAAEWWNAELHKTPELFPVLEAFLLDTQVSLYEEETGLHEFYKNTAGKFERIIGNLLGIQDKRLLDQLETLGIFIAKVNHLRDFKKYIEKQKIYFSGEQLLKHHVNLFELSQHTLSPTILNLFKDEANKAQSYFLKTSDPKIRSTRILANIYHALLDEIQRAGFPLFTHHIGLTPLRKWWIANRS